MSDDIDFIRADTLSAIFGWTEIDSIVKRQQLMDGLKSGRVAARADDATLTRAPKAGSKVYAAFPKETLQDWLVEPSVWGTAGLYLGARRYQAKNIGGFVAVELTGLWISRSDLISQLGWQEVASAPASAPAAASPAKGAPPSDLWKNFAAALVSLQTQKPSFDVAGPRKTTHKQVEEYAALFGLEIPALNTVAASLDRLKAMMACEHDDDGKPIDPPDLSEKVS